MQISINLPTMVLTIQKEHIILHHDNAQAHFANQAMESQYPSGMKLKITYSLDLSLHLLKNITC